MNIYEAIELAAFFTGGLLCCAGCGHCPYDDYMATKPEGGYDDLKFGRWVLGQGWQFSWQEHDFDFDDSVRRKSGINYWPFVEGYASNPDSSSWSYSLRGPACGGDSSSGQAS